MILKKLGVPTEFIVYPDTGHGISDIRYQMVKILVDRRNESKYNRIDPSLITTPVLLIQGEYDPLAPTDVQAKLFTRLKTADKSWIVISGGDHAAFLETPREDFISSFSGFINRFN